MEPAEALLLLGMAAVVHQPVAGAQVKPTNKRKRPQAAASSSATTPQPAPESAAAPAAKTEPATPTHPTRATRSTAGAAWIAQQYLHSLRHLKGRQALEAVHTLFKYGTVPSARVRASKELRASLQGTSPKYILRQWAHAGIEEAIHRTPNDHGPPTWEIDETPGMVFAQKREAMRYLIRHRLDLSVSTIPNASIHQLTVVRAHAVLVALAKLYGSRFGVPMAMQTAPCAQVVSP